MFFTRVIPCLLLKNQGLVKTYKFKNPEYVGDPINAVKIFNDKEVDELVFLDITATREKRDVNLKILSEIASECFMPLGYGGGIRSLDTVKQIFSLGVEKVIINSYAADNPTFISQVANFCGSQSVVVSIDIKKNLFGHYEIFTNSGTKKIKAKVSDYAMQMEKFGAGELLINSINLDGTMQGYDLELIKLISSSVIIPVIACGGAGQISDFTSAIKQGGASAVAAGSMFVFQGPHRAVLISYPSRIDLEKALK